MLVPRTLSPRPKLSSPNPSLRYGLAVWHRLASNSKFSCLNLLGVGIIVVPQASDPNLALTLGSSDKGCLGSHPTPGCLRGHIQENKPYGVGDLLFRQMDPE